jgi:hypothetical protein
MRKRQRWKDECIDRKMIVHEIVRHAATRSGNATAILRRRPGFLAPFCEHLARESQLQIIIHAGIYAFIIMA